MNSVVVIFGWRDSVAVDYRIDEYDDSGDDGVYEWRTFAEVTGNSRNEIYHKLGGWRVRKVRITVTQAQGDVLSIGTIQASSSINGKATGHMLDIGGDTMYGDLNMNGNAIVGAGAVIEANLQTPDELTANRIDRFDPGDVLCWAGEQLEYCEREADPRVVAVADESGRPIVIGAEPINVLGPVQIGDMLVPSGQPGYAVAWSQIGLGDPPSNVTIAKALEDFAGERGSIKAMIRTP